MADTSQWSSRTSIGSSVASGWGHTQSLSWTASQLNYRATDRLSLHAGFAAAGSLLGGYELQGLHNRSLAPKRQGTRLVTGHVAAEYRLSDRLTLWGSLARASGYAQPLWLDGSLPVEATAFSGGLAYRTANDALFELHFHIVHDRYGTLTADPWGYPLHGCGMPYADHYFSPWAF